MDGKEMIKRYFDSLIPSNYTMKFTSAKRAVDLTFKVLPPGTRPVFTVIGTMQTIIMFTGRG